MFLSFGFFGSRRLKKHSEKTSLKDVLDGLKQQPPVLQVFAAVLGLMLASILAMSFLPAH